MSALADELAALDRALHAARRAEEQRASDEAHGRAPSVPEGGWPDPDAATALLVRLCDEFAGGGDPEALRALVARLPDVQRALNALPWTAAAALRETGDARWLARGVAAAALENLAVDFRDTLVGLGELWRAARAAGLDPRAAFGATAERAAPEAAELLEGFEDSAYFAESVGPDD